MKKIINNEITRLLPFNKNIREKFQLIDDVYKILTIFYERYPLYHNGYLLKSRYALGYEFFNLFALNKLSEDELNFALNLIYSTIGIEDVIQHIANFAGLKIKTEKVGVDNKKITVSIVSQNIFDLNLFESKFTEFLKDVLLFQNIEFIFDLIVIQVPLNYSKNIYSLVEIQNNIYLREEEVIDL